MPLINFLAQARQEGIDSVTFLLQHQSEWQGHEPEIYKYLYKENQLQNQEVQDCFEETYLGYDTRTKVICIITNILGDIISGATDSNLRTYAKRLLIEKSQPGNDRFSLDYYRRLEALEKLTDSVSDDDVTASMKNIIENDAKYQMRIAALNKLDGLDKCLSNLHATITSKILHGFFEKKELTKDDLYKIEFIMWAHPKESKVAWQELEVQQIDRLLELFERHVSDSGLYAGMSGGDGYTPISIFASSISYSAPLYSILKFIGYHTTDKNSFDKIISCVLPLVRNQEAKRGIGLLTKSNEFLKEVSQNPAFHTDAPKWDQTNPGSAFTPEPNFEKELNYYHNVRKSSLLQMLFDETQDLNTRTAAMRMLCSSFGHERVTLRNILQIEDSSSHLNQEAQRLVSWIAPGLLTETLTHQTSDVTPTITRM